MATCAALAIAVAACASQQPGGSLGQRGQGGPLGPKPRTPGAACIAEARRSCDDTGRHFFECKDGHWARYVCRGPDGCTQEGDTVRCDTQIAEAGDACVTPEPSYACSADKTSAVSCKAGTYVVWRRCRGPGGCRIKGETVECDSTRGEVGDACTAEGGIACAVDGSALLACVGGKLAARTPCGASKKCTLSPDGKLAECAP